MGKVFFLNVRLSILILIVSNCKGGPNKPVGAVHADTPKQVVVSTPEPPALLPYDSLSFVSVEQLKSSYGTKSVVFSKNMKMLYAMNLEGMSVYEFSQKSKKVQRIFKFRQTPGYGWDYDTDRPIRSYEEKPVEAFLTNHDSILWVSLHNAEGIVPIHLNAAQQQKKAISTTDKLVYLQDENGTTKDSFYVPLIKTGKTPKVIACTSDDRILLVSNWHSLDVSVVDLNANQYPFGVVRTNIKVPGIPRGIVIDEVHQKSYVTIMGGTTLSVIDNKTWTKTGDIYVGSNPRHLLQDKKSRLYVSFNKTAQIGCVDPDSGKVLFTASTASQPRSMVLSRDQSHVFVTCYSGNKLNVFRIREDAFEKVADLDCAGNPVGVDVYEDNEYTEVWVCAYGTGLISVYRFKKYR